MGRAVVIVERKGRGADEWVVGVRRVRDGEVLYATSGRRDLARAAAVDYCRRRALAIVTELGAVAA
jgi:hypothetical protein